MFDKFNDKILYVIVNDIPYKHPNINYNLNHQWKNEYHQRNCIKRGIDILLNNNFLNSGSK